MRAIRASVVYLSTCLRVNVPKECQVLIFTCQRANQHASVPKASRFFNLACQSPKACQFFKLACQKGVPTFHLSFKKIIFSYTKYICTKYILYFVYFKYIPNIYFLYEYIFLPKFIHRV